jgi:hypothetical protein
MDTHTLVEEALAALMDGDIAGHLEYISDDVLLRNEGADQGVQLISGKANYSAYIRSELSETNVYGYELDGVMTESPLAMARIHPASDDLTWFQGALRLRATVAGNDDQSMIRMSLRPLWFGVYRDTIRAIIALPDRPAAEVRLSRMRGSRVRRVYSPPRSFSEWLWRPILHLSDLVTSLRR